MKIGEVKAGCVVVLLCAGLLSSTGVVAKKPDRARGGDDRQGAEVVVHFGDSQRMAVRNYYGEQRRAGKCPPGLAKKNNGCMPPGQARKWGVGKPLPADVVSYPLPQSVVVQLGAPPAGHRYVRVAADILLIAIGTAIVVDAIQDLGRM